MTQQQKVLHALNRLTFGPRPGSEAAVSQMGLDTWFEQQLHPETIDDSAFEQRMNAYPALRLSQDTLLARLPSPALLKAVERNDAAMPSNPIEHAIYADAIASLLEKKNRKSNGTASAQNETTSAQPAPDESRSPGAITEHDAQAVIVLAPEQRVRRLVAMTPEQMMAFRAVLRPMDKARVAQGLSPEQAEILESMVTEPMRVVGTEVMDSRLDRDIFSARQLQAVMTDFWLNHFSVYAKKSQNELYLLPAYEREAILPNALGRFEDLLTAVAKSPAMLMYLDNWKSVGPDSIAATRAKDRAAARPNARRAKALPEGINENYARELMELHTLGVNGGYTQQDVIEVAKCFTGWTMERPYQGGEFEFNENRHEPGAKTLLGHTITESGENEGLTVLHILATSPATARFISGKLAERFVSDTPPKALVDRMTATFLQTDGDIKSVLTTMFHSPEFWSPQVYRAKVKTPVEFLASAVRASDAKVTTTLPLVQALDRLGMPVYGMQTPNGYSWKAEDWVSSNALIARMNFALVLSGNKVPGTMTDWAKFVTNGSDGEAATEKTLETVLLGEPAAEQTRATVLAQFANPAMQEDAEQGYKEQGYKASVASHDASSSMTAGRLVAAKAEAGGVQAGPPDPLGTMAGLLLGSPDFQRR